MNGLQRCGLLPPLWKELWHSDISMTDLVLYLFCLLQRPLIYTCGGSSLDSLHTCCGTEFHCAGGQKWHTHIDADLRFSARRAKWESSFHLCVLFIKTSVNLSSVPFAHPYPSSSTLFLPPSLLQRQIVAFPGYQETVSHQVSGQSLPSWIFYDCLLLTKRYTKFRKGIRCSAVPW